jgi:hypothetical protein
MVAKNDITGDSIQTKGNSKAYQENLEKIFGSKTEEKARKEKEKAEYFAKLNSEVDDKLTRYNEETQEALKHK